MSRLDARIHPGNIVFKNYSNQLRNNYTFSNINLSLPMHIDQLISAVKECLANSTKVSHTEKLR